MSGTAGTVTFYRGENPLRADKLNAALVERLLRAGDSMTGPLLLLHDPVVPFEAVTKQYVDNRFSVALVSTIPPATSQGRLWFDGNTGQLFVWYDDGNSAQWVIANNLGVAGAGGGGFMPLTGGTIGTPGWLEALIPTTETNSDFVSLANRGGSAGVFGTKTSNATGSAGAVNAYAVGGFGINDNATQVQTAYGGFFRAHRNASAGTTVGVEIAVVNRGAVVQNTPGSWTTTGETIGLLVGAGRSTVTPNNNPSTAMLVTANGAKWQTGIIVAGNSINVSAGYPVAPIVLDMPLNYSLMWRDSIDRPAAYIRSDVTTSPDYRGMGGIVFTNTGIQFNSADSQAYFTLSNTGVAIIGTAAVAGTVNIGGQLAVNQGVTFSSSMLVVGASIFKSTMTFQNALAASTVIIDTAGNISNSGTTLIGIDLAVGGSVSIAHDIQISGTTFINSTLLVNGNAAYSANMAVAGTFSVTNGARINGLSPYANNAASIAAGHVTGDLYFNTTVGALSVTL